MAMCFAVPTRSPFLTRALGLLGCIVAFCGGASAEQPLPEASAPVRQLGRNLEMEFRLPEASTVSNVDASQGETTFRVGFRPFEGSSAYLFLIDSSDPSRKDAVEAGRAWILSLAAGATEPPDPIKAGDADLEPPPPLDRLWAVYRFDTELQTLADFGTHPTELPQRLEGLKADGQATEIYRNVAAAAALMKPLQADRKFLVVLSDGKPEDLPTHTLDTAVTAAVEAGVTIVGLGFAEKPSDANWLTTLRDLADRTGGFFAKASEDGKRTIPAPFADDFFALAESGGLAVVELTGAKPGKPVRIVVTTAEGTSYVREATLAAAGPWYRSPWLIGSAAGILLLAMMLVGLLRGRPAASAAESGDASDTIHGWLEVIDGDAPQRYPIRGTAVRVGRGARNDLRLANDSVSEMHAEIIRRRDGSVTLTDLGSSNGCRLNGDIVEHSVLRGGDVLEFGDVIVRYAQSVPESANLEQP